MSYHKFESDGEKFGSFEIYYNDDPLGLGIDGWYWWTCFPGCLPDGDPVGPFKTEQEAFEDAQQLCK